MKKKLLLIFLLLLVKVSLAQQINDYNKASSLDLTFQLSSSIDIQQTSSPKLEYLTTQLSLFPITDQRQEVLLLDINSNPIAKTSQDKEVKYTWNELYDSYSFGIDANVKTANNLIKIKHSDFPINNLDESLQEYTQFTEKIDINDDISNKAAELVRGKKDLFEATFSIADWVKKNIKYDLNTLTAESVQKSSWVYTNREGVCDEMTGLFISMLRSVGIPARFVSGMVYSNVGYNFGNHGWAEVYFPDIGWVPFDVTFGQYGWIDPSHIKLSDSLDSATYSAKYSWKSLGIEVNPQELELSTKVNSAGSDIAPIFNIQINLLEDEVGPGSYVPIEVTIENPYDFYVSTSLIITKAPELTEKNEKQIFLKPREKKNLFWITKTPTSLNNNFLYTSEIEVIDTFGSKSSTTLQYASKYKKITLDDAQASINEIVSNDANTYSESLLLRCSLDKQYYYAIETAQVNCKLSNLGNQDINSLDVCLLSNCQKANVFLNQDVDLTFNLPLTNKSSSTLVVNAKNNNINVNNYLHLKVYDQPNIKITSIEYQENLLYNEDFELSFVLTSDVKVKNLKLKITGQQSLVIEELKGSKDIIVSLNSKHFINRPITVDLEYEDEFNRPYSQKYQYSVNISNVPWYARLLALFRLI